MIKYIKCNGAPSVGDSLLRFSQLKISFINQNKTSFILEKCCHLTLCPHLIEPNRELLRCKIFNTCVNIVFTSD